MKSISDMEQNGSAPDVRPEPAGFRWYLRSSLPVSWLAEGLMPAIRYLRQTKRMPVVNVRRGWLHGTHVEVIAHSDDGRPVPWTYVLALLRSPGEETTPAHTEEAYLARARELGRLEQKPGPYLPFQPHGTFEWLGNSDLAAWPGHAQVLRERALTRMIDSMAVSLEPDERAPLGDSASPAMVAEIMLATADAHPVRIPYGTFSFRSHAEAFLNWSQAVCDPRPEFERRLAGDRPVLRALVERMLDGGDTRSSASWRRTASYCMGLFDSAVLAGSLTPETLDMINQRPGGALPAAMGPPGAPDAKPSKSEFHAIVDSAGVNDQPPGWFTSYRLLLNLLYMQLPLLGVSPRQRYYLCWAIAETVDEVTGESWRDRLARRVSGGR
jgi:hypothetical protein